MLNLIIKHLFYFLILKGIPDGKVVSLTEKGIPDGKVVSLTEKRFCSQYMMNDLM